MSEIPVLAHPALLFTEKCDRGTLRQENQDSVLHVRIALGDLLIVADGIGGYTGRVTASRLVVDQFHKHLAVLPCEYPASDALREAAALANAKLLATPRESEIPNVRMGCTVVAALLQQDANGPCAWVGHIGDSRAYLVRVGRLHRLTSDHSAVQSLLDRNLISQEEARHHPDIPVLTRSLGRQTKVEIDIEQHPLGIGDTLLLCSDGLWGYVPELEIEEIAASPTLENAANDLLNRALAAGGHDNISIEMARVIPPPAVAPRRSSLPSAFKWILAIFLLAIVGLCVLAYFAFWGN
jgi:protein phosphatase